MAPRIYHVSQVKDEKHPQHKKWRIRMASSNKTVAFFDTQAEALEEANRLAKEYNGSVMIHKLDGSIRKKKY